jgi:hypothetical protein
MLLSTGSNEIQQFRWNSSLGLVFGADSLAEASGSPKLGARLWTLVTDHVVGVLVGGVLGLLAPPLAILWGFGIRFAASDHPVPGWAILGASALLGWFVVTLVILTLTALGRERCTLVVAPKSPVYAWHRQSLGGKSVARVGCTFYVTNTASTPRTVVLAELVVRQRKGMLPQSRRVQGYIQDGPGQLKGGETVSALVWWTVDPPPRDGAILRAKVVLTDHLNLRASTPWLLWRHDPAG